MSTQVHFSPNKLAAALKAGKPRTVKQAIAQADENLRHIGVACAEHINQHIQLLEDQISRWPASCDPVYLREFYAISLRIIGVGSVAGLPAIDRAATSLCDVLDGMITSGVSEREPVLVHVRSRRLLNAHGQPPEVCEAVLAGLKKVRDKYMAKPA